MASPACPTTAATPQHPQCPPGISSFWKMKATCTTPPCSAADFNGKPISPACKIDTDKIEKDTGFIDPGSESPAGCVNSNSFNCDCAPTTSPIYITVTNTADTSQPVLKVFQYGNTETAGPEGPTFGPKQQQICSLGPNETCHVTTNFGVTRGSVGSGSVFTNNGTAAPALTGACPFGADVSTFPAGCGVVPS